VPGFFVDAVPRWIQESSDSSRAKTGRNEETSRKKPTLTSTTCGVIKAFETHSTVTDANRNSMLSVRTEVSLLVRLRLASME
jgi:hypothetical protein